MQSRRRRRRGIAPRGGGSSLVPVLAAVLIAVVCALVGSAIIRSSLVDYTTYTERVTAVVSEVEVSEDSDGDRRTRIYVDYQVGQEYFERHPLSGTWSGPPEVGDTFELAFPPGAPEDAVTVSMLDSGTQRVLLWVGIGMIAFGVVLVLVLGLRHLFISGRIGKRPEPPADGPGQLVEAPRDPATLTQPWPWSQVVAHRAQQATADGHRVTDLGQTVEIVDASGHYVSRLERRGTRSYRRSEGYFDGQGEGMNAGAWHRTASTEVAARVAMGSSNIGRLVREVTRKAGWRTTLGGEAVGALVVAGIGLGGGVVALLVLFVF